MPLKFVELRDSRDRNSCQFLKTLLENTGKKITLHHIKVNILSSVFSTHKNDVLSKVKNESFCTDYQPMT